MGLALKVVTEPTKEPMLLDELKVHCKVEHDEEDAYLLSLLKSARQAAEEVLGRALVETEFDYQLDAFPCRGILLPRPPVLSVTSVTYVDLAGNNVAWDAADRRLDAVSEPARLTPAYGKFYPSTRPVTGAVTVRFKAGFALNTEDPAVKIPGPIRQAIALAAHGAYVQRIPFVVGTIFTDTGAVRNLIAPYRFLLPAA